MSLTTPTNHTYLGQPVTVQYRPFECRLSVYIGEVFEGYCVNVVLSPLPLLRVHKSVQSNNNTFITTHDTLLNTLSFLLYTYKRTYGSSPFLHVYMYDKTPIFVNYFRSVVFHGVSTQTIILCHNVR